VFVNEEVSTLEQLATRAGLHGVQLHGDEPPQYCEQVTRPVIRAVRLGARAEMPAVASVPASCTLLLDAYHPTERGGTGQRADWDRAAKIAATRRTILAGGLHAGNIAEAVRRVAPWGIDVSSGVESAPGVKDAALMRAFFAALRERVEESSHDGRV
jgi:phosphoribosylanthranilate isomerase